MTTDARTRDDTESQGRVRDGLNSARDVATRAYESSRETATDAARRTVETIEANPLGILVGGLALGALAGALLPRTEREKELLAPLGATLGERARAALDAAKDAGKGELDELGISRDAATNQAKNLLDGVMKALSTAGAAAAKSATGKSTNSDANG